MKNQFSYKLMAMLTVSMLYGCNGMGDLRALQGDAHHLEAPKTPAELNVPPNQVLTMITKGQGVQIYTCAAIKESVRNEPIQRESIKSELAKKAPVKILPVKYEWVFKAPEASLMDDQGKIIGKHYAGPTWESSDGSKVGGQI